MRKHNYDVDKISASHLNSDLSYGYEFLPVSILEPLLDFYPSSNVFQKALLSGFNPDFLPISAVDRIVDLKAVATRRNHESANDNVDFLLDSIEKEIKAGFQFPFDPKGIMEIKNAVAQPDGIATKMTVNDKDEPAPKRRYAHDQ